MKTTIKALFYLDGESPVDKYAFFNPDLDKGVKKQCEEFSSNLTSKISIEDEDWGGNFPLTPEQLQEYEEFLFTELMGATFKKVAVDLTELWHGERSESSAETSPFRLSQFSTQSAVSKYEIIPQSKCIPVGPKQHICQSRLFYKPFQSEHVVKKMSSNSGKDYSFSVNCLFRFKLER